MANGIRKGLEDIAFELKGVKTVLSSIWHSKYYNEDNDLLNPEAFADEYISTEECARRLGISDQTIRNWISVGKKNKDKGWKEGIHYVNISPDPGKRVVIRIPWNSLIHSFARNKTVELKDFLPRGKYQSTQEMLE
jgi:hypothetical protein